MQLAENYVRTVASEEFRHSLLNAAHLVRITKDELACLEWLLPRIGPRNSTSFDCRMADAIAKTKWFLLVGKCMTVLSPDSFDSRHFLISPPGSIKRGLKSFLVGRNRDQHHVDIRRPKWLLPVFGAALASVSQLLCSRCHPLTEFPRKTVKRIWRYAEGFETLISKCHAHPRVSQRACRISGRGHNSAGPCH